MHFVAQAYRHAKPIGAIGAGNTLLIQALAPALGGQPRELAGAAAMGVVTQPESGPPSSEFLDDFATALSAHRHFGRPVAAVPA